MSDKIVDLTAIIEHNKSTYELVEKYVLPKQYILSTPQMKVDALKALTIEALNSGDMDSYRVNMLANILSDILQNTHVSFEYTSVLAVRRLINDDFAYTVELNLMSRSLIAADHAEGGIPPRMQIVVMLDKLNENECLNQDTLKDIDSLSIEPIHEDVPNPAFIKKLIGNLCGIVEGSTEPGYVHVNKSDRAVIAALPHSPRYGIFVCLLLSDFYMIKKQAIEQ